MGTSAVQRFYRYQAYVYDQTRWMILHGRRQAVAKMQLRPDSTVLEVGCGTGLNFPYLQEPLDPQRSRLVGLDFSVDMLKRARRRVDKQGWKNVELVAGDATRMGFDAPFDGILMAYSVTMIPDWPAALECASKLLKPGGRMVVLDFSTFDAWGPFGAVMRGWLKINHVETRRPYLEKLHALFPDLRVDYWLGGYNFTAVGQRSVNGSGA